MLGDRVEGDASTNVGLKHLANEVDGRSIYTVRNVKLPGDNPLEHIFHLVLS